jgi:hypothetical protein
MDHRFLQRVQRQCVGSITPLYTALVAAGAGRPYHGPQILNACTREIRFLLIFLSGSMVSCAVQIHVYIQTNEYHTHLHTLSIYHVFTRGCCGVASVRYFHVWTLRA